MIEECLLDIKRATMLEDILPEKEIGEECFQVSLKIFRVETFSIWRGMQVQVVGKAKDDR